MLQRLILNWVYGGVLAGILLLALTPLLVAGWPAPLSATFLLFIRNVPGVWGVIALFLYGASSFSLGWVLVAVYLVFVNAFVHIVHAIVLRRYNPGLLTALLMFLPLGGFTLILIDRAGAGSITSHLVGLIAAVVIHAAILLHVRRKLPALQRTQARPSPPQRAPRA